MSNIEKRALDLLCGECDLDPEDYCRGLRVNADEALKAIVAALTPPESHVLIQRVDAKRLVQGDTNSPGYELSCRRVAALIAARPEVK